MKKIIFICLMFLLISSMLISGNFIYEERKENKKQEKMMSEIVEIANKKEESENINFKQLYEINKDIVGWIKIENTSINYPVMQTKDNPNYYLKRNFYKEYSKFGTPYLSEKCDINDDNIIIYGHHIKNNEAVFGVLEEYKKIDYYNSHKIIEFITESEKSEYMIIAVCIIQLYTDNDFKYYEYINFTNEKQFNSYIEKCKELSLYNTGISAVYNDKFLTLSTCEYSKENNRLVIIAKKISN